MDIALYLTLFLTGSAVCYGLYTTYQTLLARRQAWVSLWHETQILLGERRQLLAPLAVALPNQQKTILFRRDSLPVLDEAAPTPELLAAEQDLSSYLIQLARALDTARHTPPDALVEWEAREAHLTHLREHYNRQAAVWNELRATFPGGLLARALVPAPLPLWEGA